MSITQFESKLHQDIFGAIEKLIIACHPTRLDEIAQLMNNPFFQSGILKSIENAGIGNTNWESLHASFLEMQNDENLVDCGYCNTQFFNPDDFDYQSTRGLIPNQNAISAMISCQEWAVNLSSRQIENIGWEIITIFSAWSYSHQFCQDCYGDVMCCESCGDLDHRDSYSGENYDECSDTGDIYCRPCLDRYGYWSNLDDAWFWDYENAPEYTYQDSDDDDDCHLQNWKPKPIFFGQSESKSFFGIELELEFAESDFDSNSTEKLLLEISQQWRENLWYHHRDGSLTNGIELVSHPMSADFILNDLNLDFVESLRERGFRSWDAKTCGIHIHCDRRGFSSAVHSYAFANLIYCNPIEWQKMAGRNSTRYASFDANARDLVSFEIKNKSRQRNRYVAVNCTNENTFEIRIFRGSLNEARIRNAFELVIAAQDYTRHLSIADIHAGKLRWNHFAKYLIENKTKFPNANLYLEKYFGNGEN
jgi:hypothetical protein